MSTEVANDKNMVIVPMETLNQMTAQMQKMSKQLERMQSKDNDKFITIKEVERLTGLCRNTILKYVELGIFKAQVSQPNRYKKYLFNRGEILNYADRKG